MYDYVAAEALTNGTYIYGIKLLAGTLWCLAIFWLIVRRWNSNETTREKTTTTPNKFSWPIEKVVCDSKQRRVVWCRKLHQEKVGRKKMKKKYKKKLRCPLCGYNKFEEDYVEGNLRSEYSWGHEAKACERCGCVFTIWYQ